MSSRLITRVIDSKHLVDEVLSAGGTRLMFYTSVFMVVVSVLSIRYFQFKLELGCVRLNT